MMTDSPPQNSTEIRPFRQLRRASKHRTSWPTDKALRTAVVSVGSIPGGHVMAEEVILAALRRLTPSELRAEIKLIRGEQFAAEDDADTEHEPGA